MKTHPFFGVQDRDHIHVMAVESKPIDGNAPTLTGDNSRYLSPENCVIIRKIDVNQNLFGTYESLLEAEDAFLEYVLENTNNKSSVFRYESHYSLPSQCLFMSLDIGKRTQRNDGNVAILGESTANLLLKSDLNTLQFGNETRKVENSNLQFIGGLKSVLGMHIMNCYVHQNWNDIESVVILYKGPGEIDSSAFLIPSDNHYNLVLNNVNGAKVSVLDYIGLVEVVE